MVQLYRFIFRQFQKIQTSQEKIQASQDLIFKIF